MEVQGGRRDGRVGTQFSTWERDHEANREGFMAVITHRTRLDTHKNSNKKKLDVTDS